MFADPEQMATVSTGTVPGYEAEPGGQMTAILELLGIPYGSDQGRGGLGAHPFDLGNPLTGLALLKHPRDSLIKVGNAITRDYDHTVIYDLTNGKKSAELKSLREFFQADIADASGWMKNGKVVPQQVAVTPDESKPTPPDATIDFLVILGESARDVVMK